MRARYHLTCALPAIALAVEPHVASAQDTTVVGRCNGEAVTAIDIRAERPRYGAAAGVWRFVENVAGRRHAATSPTVIASYLDVEVGKECTEHRRAESERKLRAQPFITLGDANLRGQGLRVEVSGERGHAYREGVGLEMIAYAAFGRPLWGSSPTLARPSTAATRASERRARRSSPDSVWCGSTRRGASTRSLR